ncbi:hypothetical protein [Acinetobacter sp. WZC-1]
MKKVVIVDNKIYLQTSVLAYFGVIMFYIFATLLLINISYFLYSILS